MVVHPSITQKVQRYYMQWNSREQQTNCINLKVNYMKYKEMEKLDLVPVNPYIFLVQG